jgi:2Fe-2S ferredoxin
MSEDEDDLPDSSAHRKPMSCLSCQITFSEALDGLRLRIAPDD